VLAVRNFQVRNSHQIRPHLPLLVTDKGPAVDRLDPEAVIEDPPDQIAAPRESQQPWLSRKRRRIDFAERDAANRRLGQLGEEFVLGLERHRLRRGREG
jgi:hypothetical protein